MALAARPDGQLAVGTPHRGASVGLDIALVHRCRGELPLDNYVGFLPTLVQVSYLEHQVIGDVGADFRVIVVPQAPGPDIGVGDVGQPLVEHRSVLFHCPAHVDHRRQYLVVHVDQGQGLLGDVGRGRRHRRHGMAFVKRFIRGQTVVAQELEVCHGPFPQVHHLTRRLGQLGRSHDRLYAGQSQGPSGVYALDAGVGMGATEDPAVQQTWQINVGPVLGPPGNLVRSIVANWPAAHHIEFFRRQHEVGHHYVSLHSLKSLKGCCVGFYHNLTGQE